MTKAFWRLNLDEIDEFDIQDLLRAELGDGGGASS
jgi:hypothetical protein